MHTLEDLLSRREVLERMGLGLVGLTISTAAGPVSPAEARVLEVPLRHLSAAEGRTLEALGEVLLPGAQEAGIAHFVDDQLGRQNPLLTLKYMDYVGEPLAFYREALAALERLSAARTQKAFAEATPAEQEALVRALFPTGPDGWSGPPAPLFYFVVRSDAVDVVYGTRAGFERLKVPYLAHLLPPKDW